MEHKATLTLSGRSRLSVWRAGVIPEYMDRYGLSRFEAELQAIRDGHLLDTLEVNNLIVSTGKALVGDLLIDAETTGLTYHALGTGTTAPAVGDTDLTTEVARKSLTFRGRTSNEITLSVFYLAAESTYDIKEAGIFGSSTASSTAGSGVMFSRYLQSYDNSGGSFDLTFDYTLTIG